VTIQIREGVEHRRLLPDAQRRGEEPALGKHRLGLRDRDRRPHGRSRRGGHAGRPRGDREARPAPRRRARRRRQLRRQARAVSFPFEGPAAMRPLVLTLKERPAQRLDLSGALPHLLTGKTAAEIARIGVETTRRPLSIGDVFRVRMGDTRHIRIEGGVDRLDWIGHGMSDGEIVVEGDAGSQAGRLMTGGRLTITGNAGPCAGSAMRGGEIEILGSAGNRLAGPLPGEMAGMRGGTIIVRGDAGSRAADRMRRGTIVVEGRAGAWAGSRMIAGTLIVAGAARPPPGYLIRRGTVVLGAGAAKLSPTFVDCGMHELVALRLVASFVAAYSKRAARPLQRPLRRLAGDMAVLGKGEIFLAGRT